MINPHNDVKNPAGDGPKMEVKTFNLCWGGINPPPRIGSLVEVKVNRIGVGEVLGYFTECNYLGVKVKPFNPPEWYVKQNGADAIAYVFGSEIGDA